MLVDMHVHSNISPCSCLSIEQIVETAYLQGLDGVCITDHESMAAKEIIKNLDTKGLTIIVGMEYTTPQGDFLLFGPVQKIPLGLSAFRLLAEVEKRGGIAIAAHPFRSFRKADIEVLEKMEIIEGINGRCTEEENKLTTTWAQKCFKKIVGGSDAHTIGEIGQVVTYFEKSVYNVEDLIEVLKIANYYPLPLKR